jgi:formylglycine-generating enzyme required for sulfatase activity
MRKVREVFGPSGAPRYVLMAVASAFLLGTATVAASSLMGERVAEVCLATNDRPGGPNDGMRWIESGRFTMGSDQFRLEEAPVREATVDGFWIDTHDVTNAQFARFVRETGYVTTAERIMVSSGKLAGSMLFSAPRDVRDLQDITQWWRIEPGANWRSPEGPGSDVSRRQSHPVVHVSHEDAQAYARWAGRTLPTETQWEFAARGGRDADAFVWGAEPDTDEAPQANYWRGIFPILNNGSKGYKGTSPVGCFPANGYGLYDMAGNVWQWTGDRWGDGRQANKSAVKQQTSISVANRLVSKMVIRAEMSPSYVIKGGSFLCANNSCMRYRPAARQPGDGSSGASHIGFRTVLVP